MWESHSPFEIEKKKSLESIQDLFQRGIERQTVSQKRAQLCPFSAIATVTTTKPAELEERKRKKAQKETLLTVKCTPPPTPPYNTKKKKIPPKCNYLNSTRSFSKTLNMTCYSRVHFEMMQNDYNHDQLIPDFSPLHLEGNKLQLN